MTCTVHLTLNLSECIDDSMQAGCGRKRGGPFPFALGECLRRVSSTKLGRVGGHSSHESPRQLTHTRDYSAVGPA